MNEEDHDEISDLQAMMFGNVTVSAALALTLIDAGLIDKGRFLDIIESLRSLMAKNCEAMSWSYECADIPVELFLSLWTYTDWKKGEVLEKLHVMEKLNAMESQTWPQMSKFFDTPSPSKKPKKDDKNDTDK